MRDIPVNRWVPLSMTAGFVLVDLLFHVPDSALGHVLLGAGMLALGLVLFALGWCGGGLAKLFAAASLWIGPNPAFFTFVTMTLVGGGVFTLVLRAWHGKLDSVPYVPVVLFALAAALPQAPIWHAMAAGLPGLA